MPRLILGQCFDISLGKPYLRAVPVSAYRNFTATVSAVEPLTPHFTRITFQGEELAAFGDAGLDQRIKIIFPRTPGDDFAGFPDGDDWYARWRELPADDRHAFRTYTPRAIRRDSGEVDVIFALHGDGGPASRWAATATVGERCVLVGPNAESPDADVVGLEFKPGRAGEFLIVGDETALPAIWSICEALPTDATGSVLLEVPTSEDILPIEVPTGVELHWLPRNGRAHGERVLSAAVTAGSGGSVGAETASVTAAADSGSDLPSGDPAPTDGPLWHTDTVADSDRFAWVAGESSMVVGVRRALVNQHGWSKKSIAFMGYWRHGRSEN